MRHPPRISVLPLAGMLAVGIVAGHLGIFDPAAARAQGLSGSISNLEVNSDAPIQIEADTLVIDEPKRVATFSGRVRATQDNMVLNTDTLIVHYSTSNAGEGASLKSVDAKGSVVMKVDDQTARGNHAHYDIAKEEMVLSGNVVLSQGENAIQGQKIVVNLKTGTATMVSEGRVKGVFTPNR